MWFGKVSLKCSQNIFEISAEVFNTLTSDKNIGLPAIMIANNVKFSTKNNRCWFNCTTYVHAVHHSTRLHEAVVFTLFGNTANGVETRWSCTTLSWTLPVHRLAIEGVVVLCKTKTVVPLFSSACPPAVGEETHERSARKATLMAVANRGALWEVLDEG